MSVVLLPGDGIGVEVVGEARKVLAAICPEVKVGEFPIGSGALAATGEALPAETLAACLDADAVMLGAVGASDYLWSAATASNPEDGMFKLRKTLDVYANLRPFRDGQIDLLIVRELVGGLYYGERGTRADGTVFDVLEYRPDQVERVLRRAFELARTRRGRLTSVDKANVLATSRMWRDKATAMAAEYPDVELDHLLVDTAAMRLVEDPARFDVIVTENTFGDILSDIAAALAGGLGVAASASLGDSGPGLFEPVHGTAPDIAGEGVANPTAALRSLALLLRFGLDREDEGVRLEAVIDQVAADVHTADRGGTAGTAEFGDAVVAALGGGVAEVADV
jgi:3-isopropylmalate dehydrogenase